MLKSKKKKARKLIHEPYDKLKGALRGNGVTYRKAAKLLCLAVSTFSDKINGFSDFTITEAKMLTELAHFNAEGVFFGNTDKSKINQEHIEMCVKAVMQEYKNSNITTKIVTETKANRIPKEIRQNEYTINRTVKSEIEGIKKDTNRSDDIKHMPAFKMMSDERWQEYCKESAIRKLKMASIEPTENNINKYFLELKVFTDYLAKNEKPPVDNKEQFSILPIILKEAS